MKVVAIIPVREFRDTKFRLRGLLDESERASLTRSLLYHTLANLESSNVEATIIVASERRQVSRLAKKFSKALVINERTHHGGVNKAMEDGIAYVRKNLTKMSSIMLIPSDLPLLSSPAINIAISKLKSNDLVLAPSIKRDGTNLILFKMPEGKIPLHYDDNSYKQHLAEARKLKIRHMTYQPYVFLLDVDSPGDFRKLMKELKVRSFQELTRKLSAVESE